jgi:plasmid rolling circle replication initiator protein Rep
MAKDPSTLDVAVRMANCAGRLGLAIEQEGENPKALIESGHFCHARLCPFCEWRRVRAWRGRLLPGLEAFTEAFPKYSGVFLTLTVRNVPVHELRRAIKEMHKAWALLATWKVFPTRYWLRRTEVTLGRPCFNDELPDGVRAANSITEFVPTRDGLVWAHPHIHALLLVPPAYWTREYVKKRTWAEQWALALGIDYEPVVDIRRASPKNKVGDATSDIKSAAIEAAKYTTKATDLHALGDHISEFHYQLKNLRLIGVSTKLAKYVNGEDITTEEMLDKQSIFESTNPLLRCIAEWCEEVQEYKIIH